MFQTVCDAVRPRGRGQTIKEGKWAKSSAESSRLTIIRALSTVMTKWIHFVIMLICNVLYSSRTYVGFKTLCYLTVANSLFTFC